MATRRIGRSIIECGRGRFNAVARKQRNRSARRWTLVDGEYEPGPRRGEGPELRDNLRPLERWLLGNVGRPWSKVFSEFSAREDQRTLRGDHVHRHLKEMVRGSGGQDYCDTLYGSQPSCWEKHGRWRFWLDAHGILRHHTQQDCDAQERRDGFKIGPVKPYVWKFQGKEYKTWEEYSAAERAAGFLTVKELHEHLRKMDEGQRAGPVIAPR